ncbi:Imidazole glycerol phosphate synthase subunit HisH [Dirofilaria immitis]
MTETNSSNDMTQEQKDACSHRGFSQKVRGILLESQSVTSDKLPNIPNKNVKTVGQTTAPHRGFNEKAREVLLDRKNPGTTASKVKGSEKIRHLL